MPTTAERITSHFLREGGTDEQRVKEIEKNKGTRVEQPEDSERKWVFPDHSAVVCFYGKWDVALAPDNDVCVCGVQTNYGRHMQSCPLSPDYIESGHLV